MKRFAVIGYPITHSLSPILHQEIYRQLEINASFEKFHIKPDDLHSFMNSNKLDGFNVNPNLKSFKVKDLFEIYAEEFGLNYK